MGALALRVASRAWKRVLLVALALAIATTIFGYYRVMVAGLGETAFAITTRAMLSGDILAYHGASFPAALSGNLLGLGEIDRLWMTHQKRVWTRHGSAAVLAVALDQVVPDPARFLRNGTLPQADGEVLITEHTGRVSDYL